jgi:hypothetical protein
MSVTLTRVHLYCQPERGEMKIHLAKWNDAFISGWRNYTNMILSYARADLTQLRTMATAEDPNRIFRNNYFNNLFNSL